MSNTLSSLPSSPAAEPAATAPLSGLAPWVQTAGNLTLAFVILPQPLSADRVPSVLSSLTAILAAPAAPKKEGDQIGANSYQFNRKDSENRQNHFAFVICFSSRSQHNWAPKCYHMRKINDLGVPGRVQRKGTSPLSPGFPIGEPAPARAENRTG